MKWESKLIKYKGTARISVAFEKNIELIARIKTIEGSRWSQSLGVWHIPDTEENSFDSSATQGNIAYTQNVNVH